MQLYLSVSSQIFELVTFSNDLFDTVTSMNHEQNFSQHLLLQASSTGNPIQMQGRLNGLTFHHIIYIIIYIYITAYLGGCWKCPSSGLRQACLKPGEQSTKYCLTACPEIAEAACLMTPLSSSCVRGLL
jgi:hypothetical protein